MASREYVERALDAGACGYIVKDEGADVMLALVRRAAQGDIVLSPAATAALKSRHSE
jgi:DNA-binding NarL/FixJ family response regulator